MWIKKGLSCMKKLSPICLLLQQPHPFLGVHGKLGGDTAGTADHQEIPYHMASFSAYRAGEGRRKKQTFRQMLLAFPSLPYMWWGPASPAKPEHPTAQAKGWINSLFYFACMAFALPEESLSQYTSFLASTLVILFPFPPGECIV